MDNTPWEVPDEDFYKAKKEVQNRKSRIDNAYKENSKKRLLNNIQSKFRTTMIGALDKFEKAFGYLWGHNKQGRLTDEELEMREIWEDVRTQILDNGNNNMRAAQQEIAQYTLSFNQYKITSKENQDDRS